MRLTPNQRLGLAAFLFYQGIFFVLVAGFRALPSARSPVSALCADSPAPGLCAILHGQAMAARREGPNEGGGGATASSAGGGGQHSGPNVGGGPRTGSTHGCGGNLLCREHPEQCEVPLWSLDLEIGTALDPHPDRPRLLRGPDIGGPVDPYERRGGCGWAP